jgi:hypothetical protein
METLQIPATSTHGVARLADNADKGMRTRFLHNKSRKKITQERSPDKEKPYHAARVNQ